VPVPALREPEIHRVSGDGAGFSTKAFEIFGSRGAVIGPPIILIDSRQTPADTAA